METWGGVGDIEMERERLLYYCLGEMFSLKRVHLNDPLLLKSIKYKRLNGVLFG